jgi:hypothetical protein
MSANESLAVSGFDMAIPSTASNARSRIVHASPRRVYKPIDAGRVGEGAPTDIDDLRRAGELFGVWHKEAAAFV